MNHLRDLIEQINKGAVRMPGSDLNPLNAKAVFIAKVLQMAEQAQCFWLGDLDNENGVRGLAPIPELARLPFQTVWFEGDVVLPDAGIRCIAGLLMRENSDGQMVCIQAIRAKETWHIPWFAFDICVSKHDFAFKSWPGDEILVNSVRIWLYTAMAFCSALNCTNVYRQEHTPSEKLQKARARRGKAPLFSYWTLVLNGGRGESRDLGGTHASPRVHLRRGHARQYAPGKWTWVQPHAVGNPSAGMVHKDYVVGPGLTAT